MVVPVNLSVRNESSGRGWALPDSVMQDQLMIPIPPIIPQPRVLVNHERSDTKLFQPRCNGESALSSPYTAQPSVSNRRTAGQRTERTNNQNDRFFIPFKTMLRDKLISPIAATGFHLTIQTRRSPAPGRLLMTLDFVQDCREREDFPSITIVWVDG